MYIKQCLRESSVSLAQPLLQTGFGLLTAGALVPRVAVRLLSKSPAVPPGHAIEQLAGRISHAALYGLLFFLPASGITMGYMGGKGLPFFTTTITPASGKIRKAKDGKLAGQAYKWHKRAGTALEYMIPLHVGAVGFHHLAKGQRLLARVNPFAK